MGENLLNIGGILIKGGVNVRMNSVKACVKDLLRRLPEVINKL